MFKLQRTKRVKETLALCDEDGNALKTLQVDFDADVMGQKFTAAWNDIVAAEQQIKAFEASMDPTQANAAFEAYGQAVIALLRLVFGDDNAAAIVEHYENRPTEIATEVYPFIMQVVLPKVQAAAKDKTERLKANYYASKR